MAQRNSEYTRQPRDLYETPAWVTRALIPHLPEGIESIWEPACGSGKMVRALRKHFKVIGTDLRHRNFLHERSYLPVRPIDAIITNPPYGRLAQLFVEKAIELMRPEQGTVAMLMSVNFDTGATREHLFGDCRIFKKKLVLTKRIVWFKRTDGEKEAPSTNHAWYIWDFKHIGPTTIAYHYE
jgi:hypothetical protein